MGDLCGFNLRSHLSPLLNGTQRSANHTLSRTMVHTTLHNTYFPELHPIIPGQRLPPPPPSPPSSSSSRRERARSPQPAPAASAVTRTRTQSDAERASDCVRRRHQPGGVVVALDLSWLRQQSDARRPACIAARGNTLLLRTSDGYILALARSA